MLRKTLLLTVALVLVAAVTAAGATDGTVPAAAGFPESIAVQPGTSTFFVSSFTTGAVYRGSPGHPARVFLRAAGAGRTSAAGVKFEGPSRLMVISGTSPLQLDQLQIFSSKTGRHEATFTAPAKDQVNLNDAALGGDGNVYITDFATPAIYRVTGRQLKRGSGTIARWLVPPARIVPTLPPLGNFNGIAATADGRYLIVGQTGNGALYRVDIATRTIIPIKIRGGSLAATDGILLRGHTLYVASHQNAVVELALGKTYATARVTHKLTDASLDVPTSVTADGNRLLVSNGAKPATATDYQITTFPLPKR
jgi:sugar lactone lactonase YvrE